ncbi:MAG: DUF4837 family protein [Candidatus Eisenbacteria bacterium]|nr:DUF4837 family protein [Candidatus Eisenbacteria bacterium]
MFPSARARFLLIPLALLLLLSGCEGLLPAVGSYAEIYVVTEREPSEEILRPLRRELEVEFETVQMETLFQIIPLTSSGFKEIDTRKNFLLLVDLSGDENLLREARRLIGGEEVNRIRRSGGAALRFVENAWARQQAHAILFSPSRERLPFVVEQYGSRIRDGFLQLNRKRILEYLLFRGEKRTLERKLFDAFGWWIRIPAPFTPDVSLLGERFFSMKMDRPGRMLFVSWRDGVESLPTEEELIALRDSLTWKHYDEDFAEPDYNHTSRGSFQGHEAVRIRGLWQNEKYTIGGPFRSIAFRDEKKNRLYFLDYAVYAPGYDKKYYLWELEAVVETFDTKPPPEPEDS